MKIYLKYANKTLPRLQITKKGDWIDLYAAETTTTFAPVMAENSHSVNVYSRFLSLGIAMKLPEGFEAIIAPRSSLFKNKGVVLTNSIGIIDNCYCGDSDIWGANFLCFRDGQISEGEKILQFRIQLSQKASIKAKFKWLFTRNIKFVEVNNLGCESRGGFGSTKGYK